MQRIWALRTQRPKTLLSNIPEALGDFQNVFQVGAHSTYHLITHYLKHVYDHAHITPLPHPHLPPAVPSEPVYGILPIPTMPEHLGHLPLAPGLPPLVPSFPLPVDLHGVWLAIQNSGNFLAHIASDVASLQLPLSIAMPVCRLLNWLYENKEKIPSVHNWLWETEYIIKVRPNLNDYAVYYTRAALLQQLQLPNALPISLPDHYETMLGEASKVSAMQNIAPVLHTMASNNLRTMTQNLDNRAKIQVPQYLGSEFVKHLNGFCPEFGYLLCTNTHPHGACATVRKISMSILAQEASRNGKPNVMVAGSPHQVSSFPNVVHNHAPLLSGRDVYRHQHGHNQMQRLFSQQVSCRHTVDSCPIRFPATNVIVPLVPDISVKTLALSMIDNNQIDAFVLTHLPIPFLDKRVNKWTDDVLRVEFTRRDGKIYMEHLESASAGYVNAETSMMSWALPTPVISGHCIILEELRHIGSMYIFHLKVVPGEPETYPVKHIAQKEDFYILPRVKSKVRLSADETTHTVIQARRFDVLTKFALSAGTARSSYEIVCAKLRGMEAEIKIAGTTIQKRLSLSPEDFNTIVTHVMIHAQILRMDHEVYLKKGYDYVQELMVRAHGNLWQRYWRYVVDNLTLKNTRRHRLMFEDSLSERILNSLLAGHWSDSTMEDPYSPHGKFTVIHQSQRFISVSATPYFNRSRTEAEFEKIVRLGPEMSEPTLQHYVDASCNTDKVNVPEWMFTTEAPAPDTRFKTSKGKGKEDEENESSESSSHDTAAEKNSDSSTRPATPGPSKSQPQPSEAEESMPSESWSSIVEDEEIRDAELPKLSENHMFFELADHLVDESRAALNSTVDFKGDVSFIDPATPTRSQLDFSTRFGSFEDVLKQINDGDLEIPLPDRGALTLAKEILKRTAKSHTRCTTDFETYGDKVAAQDTGEKDDNDSEGFDYAKYAQTFFYEVAKRAKSAMRPKYRNPSLILDGIAGSAKSTLAREIIALDKSLIVVPSRALAHSWKKLVSKNLHTVVTQHKLPKDLGYRYLIIDEANLLEKEHLMAWLFLAWDLGIEHVIACGDVFQQQSDNINAAEFGSSPLIAPRLRFYNSFTIPLDAFCAFLSVNSLTDARYMTLCKVKRSTIVVDRDENSGRQFRGYDLFMNSYVHARPAITPTGSTGISVSQAQGLRSKRSYFSFGLPAASCQWFQDRAATQTVLFTRHQRCLVIDSRINVVQSAFPNLDWQPLIKPNGQTYSQMMRNRPMDPSRMDVIFRQVGFEDQKFTNSAAVHVMYNCVGVEELATIIENPDATELDEDRTIMPESLLFAEEVLNPAAQNITFRHNKEEYPIVFPKTYGLLSVGELEYAKPAKIRTHLPNMDTLGDVQMSKDSVDDALNMAERQCYEPGTRHTTQQDWDDARVLFNRFVETFLSDEYSLYEVGEYAHRFFSTRGPNYVGENPYAFGEAAATIDRKGFFKTQVKVKPGLAGQRTHGQTVIANDEAFTNYFGAISRIGYANLCAATRPDFIVDVGLSDKDLSRLIIDRGIGARFERWGNMQIDLSKQDSTHRPAHVIASIALLKMLGVPEEALDLYFALRSEAFVRSMNPGVYKAIVHWNLGSGDPFTLLMNCLMMMQSIAVRYDGIRSCAGIQKGDDFTCSKEGIRLSRYGAIFARLRVVMKIDLDLPTYHAGRFIRDGVLMADPVRAFLRHFSKPVQSQTTNFELYQSFMDRLINYTDEQTEWLEVACYRQYKSEFTMEEISYMISTVKSLRSWKNFQRTYKHANREQDDIYSPQEDCAALCAKRLKPGLQKTTLALFRSVRNVDDLVDLYRRFGINAMRGGLRDLVPDNFVGVVVSSKHVFAKLPPTAMRL